MKSLKTYISESLTGAQSNYFRDEIMDCLYDVFDEEFEVGEGSEYYKNYSEEAKELLSLHDELAELSYNDFNSDNKIFKEKLLRFTELTEMWKDKLSSEALEALKKIKNNI